MLSIRSFFTISAHSCTFLHKMYTFACYKNAICMNISVCCLAAEKKSKILNS